MLKRQRRRSVHRVPLALSSVELPGDQVYATSLDLEVEAGTVVALQAPEEVCNSLVRLVKGDEQAVAGEVTFMGRDLATFKRRELERLRTQHLAVVTAIPYLDNSVPVSGNLAVALMLRGIPQPEVHNLLVETLRALDMPELLNRRPADLTLSETRWVAMLRGVLMQPQLLLVEPGAIDTSPDLAKELVAVVRENVRGTHTGVLWVTTSTRCACYADRMFLYSMGRLHDADDNAGVEVSTT